MPTHEPIAPPMIPKVAEAPIPTRTVTTRAVPKVENVTQPPIVETPAAESATEESVKLSPQASAAARKEQAYRQREAVLKQREADLEAKLKQAEQYSQLKTKLDAKDYSEAEALGLSYEGYTEYLLSKKESENPETQAFKKLEEEITSIKKYNEEKATQEYEETVAAYQKEIATLVSANPDFSSVKELGREDAVLQLILDSWEQDGLELTVEQASKDIEEFLVEEATKMASISKVKAKEPERKLPPPKPALKTLTQQVNVGADRAPMKSLSSMSDAERYAEARRRAIARREGK